MRWASCYAVVVLMGVAFVFAGGVLPLAVDSMAALWSPK
jgi:hypothetical protein